MKVHTWPPARALYSPQPVEQLMMCINE